MNASRASRRPLPTAESLDALLEDAAEIARRAGALVRARSEAGRTARHKGHAHNLVTETDLASEALIVAEIERRHPDHGILAEEGGRTREGTLTWIVDPLDGTNNFAHGFPMFCVNLAVAQGDELLVGATYDPLRDELFTARRGGGARLDGRPISVSRRTALAEAIVASGFPYDKASNPDNNLAQVAAVVPRVRGFRRAGSAALDLAYVACGRLDAYWERGTQAWDVAAGILQVREAGGRVTDYAGGPPRVDGGRFVASNGRIHEELRTCLAASRTG